MYASFLVCPAAKSKALRQKKSVTRIYFQNFVNVVALMSTQSLLSSCLLHPSILVHPEHEEADENEGSKEGEQIKAMSGEVESLKIPFQSRLRKKECTPHLLVSAEAQVDPLPLLNPGRLSSM